jgi:hypothetical protein
VPRPPCASSVEYDHNYQYLPENAPDRIGRLTDETCGPGGRWWVAPSVELTWVPTRPAPTTVQLRMADPAGTGGTVPGPILPVSGLATQRFGVGFGLSGGWWFGEGNRNGVDASFLTRDANTIFNGFAPGALVEFPQGTGHAAYVIPLPAQAAPAVMDQFPATLGTYFATADVNYRHNWLCSSTGRLDVVAGYRYAFLGDELWLGDVPTWGNGYRLNRAAVSNTFNGAQIGLAGETRAGKWYANGSAKIAFGVTRTDVEASGAFLGATGWTPNGASRLTALSTIGQNGFAVMPTVNLQVGRQITRHARVFAGYTFTYLSRAGRIGDALNPANATLNTTDFWVQSIGFGADIRF